MSAGIGDDKRRAIERMHRALGMPAAHQILRDLGDTAAARYLEATERERVCRQMLHAHESRADIRDRLQRKGLSRRAAYLLIAACKRDREIAHTHATMGLHFNQE